MLPDGFEQPRFDVAVEDTPLRMFLTGLVSDSPFNIVAHPDIGGKVNLNLSNVTVVDVLEVLRDVSAMEVSGNLVRVMPNIMQTEVFTLDYVSVSREGVSDMRVSTGSVRDAGTTTQGFDQNNGRVTLPDPRSVEVVGSRVTTENTVIAGNSCRH